MISEGMLEEDVRAVILSLKSCGYLDLAISSEDILVDEIMDHLSRWPTGIVGEGPNGSKLNY